MVKRSSCDTAYLIQNRRRDLLSIFKFELDMLRVSRPLEE
jgi:hypothetical protein